MTSLYSRRYPAANPLAADRLGTWGLDPVAAYEWLQGRVVHVHLSNFNEKEHYDFADSKSYDPAGNYYAYPDDCSEWCDQ